MYIYISVYIYIHILYMCMLVFMATLGIWDHNIGNYIEAPTVRLRVLGSPGKAALAAAAAWAAARRARPRLRRWSPGMLGVAFC